ncbi:hypothetical protein HMI54_012856 [Coelomomyces lativittatus]|nr:hypothetical protein HMI54_012856 [Coelomomyces lativittatus]
MFKKISLSKNRNIRNRPSNDESLKEEGQENDTAEFHSTSATTSLSSTSFDGESMSNPSDAPSHIKKRTVHSSFPPNSSSISKLVATSNTPSSSSISAEPLKVIYASSGNKRMGPDDLGATRTINIDGNDTLEDKLHTTHSTLEKRKLSSTTSTTSTTSIQEENIKKKPKFHRIGPQLAPSYLRVTSRMDYQPDVCKDYKETGFCGYGDSCKFLHDRGDYKLGWELDQEWNEKQREKRKLKDISLNGEEVEEEEEEDETFSRLTDETNSKVNWIIDEDVDEDDTLPFACYLCRASFTSPIVTKCNHFFCEACILKHSKTSFKCPVYNTF